MNRVDFMKQLERNLKKLPKEEILDALQYYEDYFDDMGVENESQALINLGSPQKVAVQIKAESYLNVASEEQGKVKMGIKTFQLVMLAICASPIALPLVAAAVIVAASLLLSVYAVYASFLAIGVIFLATAICAVPLAIITCFIHFPSAIAMLGYGFIVLGSGYLCLLGTFALMKQTYRWTIKKVAKKIKRGSGK